MTGDLIAFLNARLDEDEAAAEAVRSDQDYADSEHQERHHPARVLREVAAKREIIAEYERDPQADDRYLAALEFALERLAEAYGED